MLKEKSIKQLEVKEPRQKVVKKPVAEVAPAKKRSKKGERTEEVALVADVML